MLGDAAGIGPEISVKALASGGLTGGVRVVIVGDRRVLELGMREAQSRISYTTHPTLDGATWRGESVPLVDLGNLDPAPIEKGRVSAVSGGACIQTLKYLVDHALSGQLDAICFAPLHKAALHRGGSPFNDGAGLIASMAGYEGDFGEMNVIPQFSTFRVTSHVSLRSALGLDHTGKDFQGRPAGRPYLARHGQSAAAPGRCGVKSARRGRGPARRRGNPRHRPGGTPAAGRRLLRGGADSRRHDIYPSTAR